jgi:Protein of unknown function (DUF4239)
VTLILIIALCFLAATVTTLVHVLIHRRVKGAVLQPHNEVTAAVYATFGVLYAVILGLLVSHGQTRRDLVAESSVREAAMLVDLSQAARTFGPSVSDSLRLACLRYAEHVATQEWNVDVEHNRIKTHHHHFGRIWSIVRSIEPIGPRQESVYLSMLDILAAMAEERYQRISATGDHMSPFLKIVLLIGAGVTVVFLWFFGMLDRRIHLMYTWLVSLMLALVLVLIFALDNPMQLGVGVKPDAYIRAAEDLRSLPTD